MDNYEIWNLIQEYQKELENLWYDMSEDNLENIINWFISISNSILPDWIERKRNVELNNIIVSNLYDNLVEIYKISIDWEPTIKFEEKEYKSKYWVLLDIAEKENHNNLLNDLENTNKISKIRILKVINDIKNNKGIIDLFHRWLLTKEQEQLLAKIWFNYKLK